MTKHRLIAAASIALAAAAIGAATGSAQSSPTSLHLVSRTQKHVGFFPSHRGGPRQGDRFGFGQKVTGSDTGFSRVLCTDIDKQLVCTIQIKLSHGTLTAQGIVPQHANRSPVAITGGTGAYDGARGTALATDVSATKTIIDVSLRP